MKFCDSIHELIVYDSKDCHLCIALDEITDLKETIYLLEEKLDELT